MKTYDLILISCCGKKLSGRHQSQDIYQSTLFKLSKKFAEQHGKDWAILSAKHGLVRPSQEIEDYDLQLSKAPSFRKEMYRFNVAKKLREIGSSNFQENASRMSVAVLAGRHYLEPFYGSPSVRHWFHLSFPLDGLQIGERLNWLKSNTREKQYDLLQLESFA
ncbi:MAG: DUF6884 domain-containing protein [Alphaproteobacteria bacterium]